ncbi:type II toxin-antitoxin system toxin RelE3 [Desulfotomaculum defluvii]
MNLILTEQAIKDLSKLEKHTQKRIADAMDRMLEEPRNADIKKLKGEINLWRLRVGDHRVIFRIEQEQITIYAMRVLHRREVYKKL